MTPAALAAGATRTLIFVRHRSAGLRTTARRAGVRLLALAKAHKPARRGVAKALVFAGGLITTVGVALIYLPAGVILAGPCLIVWALLIFDVEPPR